MSNEKVQIMTTQQMLAGFRRGINEYKLIRDGDRIAVGLSGGKEPNPCALGAKMRKGALMTAAARHGCNKVALGHHADDFIETMLLSLFYEGRLSTMSPKVLLDRTGVVQIRPMLYLEEKNIAAYAKNLPVTKSRCPADKKTKREYVKKVIDDIKRDIPFVRDRMYSALMHPERYNLFDKFREETDLF